MNKVVASVEEALADVFDGATIMFGGFAASGNPTNLVRALRARGTKRITAIANNIGFGDSLDMLCEEGQIEKMIASFAIRATGSNQSLFEQQYLRGEVELELVPQGTLAERIRAGGAGIPAFFVPTGVDTVVEEGKRSEVFDGGRYLMERALTADFALLKAYRADTLGNLVYRLGGRNFNVPMATAAQVTIVEVEEIVEPGELDPELIVTPGVYVDRVVQAERHDVDWFN